jgi:hypothetical protein
VGRPAVLMATALAGFTTAVLAMIAAGNLALIGVLRLRDHRRRAGEISKTASP